MSLTQREAFARLMEHMCRHDGDGGHGYSQVNRMGNGTTERVDLGDGVTVTIAGGDRDCSSGIVTCLRAVGVDTHGASYTGNMRVELLKSGLFRWERMGVASARRGDIYLNEGRHTAMCTSASPDMLAQFSISENGTIRGRTGDQTGRESNIKAYYSYPWDGKLVWLNDGATIGGAQTGVADSTDSSLGDMRYTGPKMIREWQRQRGTEADGKLSNQSGYVRQSVLLNVEASVYDGSYNERGSSLVRSVQALVGADVDGQMGHGSCKALQVWLRNRKYYAGEVDGLYGPATSLAVGRALRANAFRD